MNVEGLAIPYGALSRNLGGFFEVVLNGAIELADDVQLLFQHDQKELLARTSSGTLNLDLTPEGLRFSATLPESRNDIAELIQRADLSKCSFGFTCIQDDWEISEGEPIRYLERILVSEITICVNAAYEQTSVIEVL
jgi:HK97 family phage prohead protease